MKIIKVETCGDCPYCHWNNLWKEYECLKDNGKIRSLTAIPSWCPLEDSDESHP